MIRATILVAISAVMYLSGVAIAASEIQSTVEARRSIPRPPTSCQGCKDAVEAIANASDCD